MKTLFVIAAAVAIVSCKKHSTPPVSDKPIVEVSAAVTHETVTTSSGTFKYWQSIATVNKALLDTSFVIVQWDAYSAPGSYESTLRDTVTFLPYQSGTVSHRSRIVYMSPWFADDVKVVAAWDKHGKHQFVW